MKLLIKSFHKKEFILRRIIPCKAIIDLISCNEQFYSSDDYLLLVNHVDLSIYQYIA